MQESVMFFPLTKIELQETIKSAVAEVLNSNRKAEKERELLNSDQLCNWLGISLSTLNVWKRENKIPYKKLGKRVFFSRAEVFGALKESHYSRLKELGA